MTARGIDGFEVVVLTAGELEAAFAPGVGMVGASLCHRGEELLGQRGGLSAYAERGSSFGIPLLHPWANRVSGSSARVTVDFERSPLRPDEHGLAIHGLLAAERHWRLEDADSATLAAELDFDRPELLAAFPFPHTLRLDVGLDPGGLEVATTVTPTGDEPVPIAFGWHPYLTLPGVPRERWEVTLPVTSRALLDDRGIPTGATEDVRVPPGALGDRTYDDLFPALEPSPTFALEGGGRRISVAFGDGYPVAQVYAPPGSDFICFEPMTAPTNALVSGDGLRLADLGAPFTARFRIDVA